MDNNELDFLASCISWIDDEQKRQQALTLCDSRYERSSCYCPSKFREILKKKLELANEFGLAITNSAVEDLYCSDCGVFCSVPRYSVEDIEFACDCGNVLEPVTDRICAEFMVRNAKDQIASEDGIAVFADGFEQAFVGLASQFNKPSLAVYDLERCIDILMGQEMSREQAIEYMSFNVTGAWVGEGTPLFLKTAK